MKKDIPRIVIAATQSGSGKTTITTGILGALRERGYKVQSYKIGPDYIDPGYHELASGRPCHNLDSWLVPAEKLPYILADTAGDADIAVIEGVMGLYDGGRGGISSTASIAKILQAPVMLAVTCQSMGESAAALIKGFKEYDTKLNFAGVILNKLGSEAHKLMINEALDVQGTEVLGTVFRNVDMSMPERHLGLLPTTENEKENEVVKAIIENVGRNINLDRIIEIAKSAPPLEFIPVLAEQKNCNVRIGTAYDEAFSFYYQDSLSVLKEMGAEIVHFSPLHDDKLPDVDGLIFGGGFPEMFAEKLSNNEGMRSAIKKAAEDGMPVYAECGGYMYLLENIIDFDGKNQKMVGIFNGTAEMGKKLNSVGYVTAELLEDTVIGEKGKILKGHEFHFSAEKGEIKEQRAFEFCKVRIGKKYIGGCVKGNAIGSYLHMHFAGEEDAALRFVESCANFRRRKTSGE